jgi:vancomycin resistance protein YoaR
MNDIPLQGMTLDQAAQYVTSQVENRLAAFRITLRTVDGRTWDITKDDLQMKYDAADRLDRLWSIGHIGNAETRYEAIKNLQDTEVRQYSTMSYDLSKVNQILTQIKAEVDQPAVNATRVEDETKWPPYSYTDDVPGTTLDITGLNERIMGMVDRLESGVVELTPVQVEAKVTRAALEGSIVKLATYETAIGATSHEGRFKNIEIGTLKFNHLVIHAGEQVSFNKITGKRTEANGFVEAPEIAYGEYVMGIGGGICQVSSTLYNAVVNAGLEIVKREQHSLASNYVPMGLDATVSDERLDFVFKNSTNADIFFETSYYKKKNYWYTSFTIYGRPDPNGYTYKLESEVREEIPLPDPVYRPDRNAQYVVYDNQTQLISKGEIGHIVDVYLVTTDSSGLQISRVLKYTDTYKPVAPVYWVGVTPRTTN